MKQNEYIDRFDGNSEKPVIIIPEATEPIDDMPQGEEPIIIIERDSDSATPSASPKPRKRLPWIILGGVIGSVCLLLCLVLCYMYYARYIRVGIDVSVTPEQNIEKLSAMPSTAIEPEVRMTTDTVGSVIWNKYELRGLKAEVTFEEPDTLDESVYLYSHCADQTSYNPKNNHYLGSLVVNGEEIESSTVRLGYCAMANDNVVIGVARSEKVKDYCIENGGSFFRQFILVSDGQLPKRFYLHGIVERRAIARLDNDQLYYIESVNKETLLSFAEAIRSYGFTDAIYITGGNDYSYYRDKEGNRHDISDISRYPHKGTGIVPWLVFRKR